VNLASLASLGALGVRIATAGRSALARLALMVLGFAVGASVLIAALSIVPASRNHDARESGRVGSLAMGRGNRDMLFAWPTTQRWYDQEIGVWALAAHGAAAVPLGVDRAPEPGEAFVSPALAELMKGAAGPDLERRFHAHVVGTIGPMALIYPDELFAYVGKPQGVDLSGRPVRYRIRSVDESAAPSKPLDLTALLAIVALACAVLIPIWVFVATATRLSTATRHVRLAAVRLAGATAAEVRYLAAIEAATAAFAGAIAGLPIFLASRALLSNGLILGKRFFPSDFAPPMIGVLAVVLGLPMIAIVITVLSMRHLVISPIGVTRPQRRRKIRSAWPLILLAGIALLGWIASQHAAFARRGSSLAAELMLGVALTLIAFGLSGTAIWGAWIIARVVGGRARSASTLLAMRRLEADPSVAMRMVGGVAVVIALAGVIHAGLRSDQSPDGPSSLLAPWVQRLPSNVVIVEPFQSDVGDTEAVRTLERTPGVLSLRMVRKVVSGVTRTQPTTAIVKTDGSAVTLERLRDQVGWIADVATVDELRSEYLSAAVTEYHQIDRLVKLVTIFLLLVIAASFLVAAVDWIIERRHALAVLSAMGTPRSVLTRALLLQVALPLTASSALGYAGAIIVIAFLYRAIEARVVFPFAQLGVLTSIIFATVVGVTVLTLPWIARVRDPELLHAE
jgi:hypothetical protein